MSGVHDVTFLVEVYTEDPDVVTMLHTDRPFSAYDEDKADAYALEVQALIPLGEAKARAAPYRVFGKRSNRPPAPLCDGYVARRAGMPANAGWGLPCRVMARGRHNGQAYCLKHLRILKQDGLLSDDELENMRALDRKMAGVEEPESEAALLAEAYERGRAADVTTSITRTIAGAAARLDRVPSPRTISAATEREVEALARELHKQALAMQEVAQRAETMLRYLESALAIARARRRCPDCEGRGTVEAIADDSTTVETVTCLDCEGEGIR